MRYKVNTVICIAFIALNVACSNKIHTTGALAALCNQNMADAAAQYKILKDS